MKRIPVTPRSDYREKIEALGFDFMVIIGARKRIIVLRLKKQPVWRKQPMRRTICIVRLLNSLLKITRNLWSVH